MGQSPVIILNWNGWEDTFACLRSLRQAPDVQEVWLADNGSREDRCGEAEACYPGLRVLQLGENLGYAGGNNRALRIAAQEGRRYAYLLNNDCEVEPGFLQAALDAAEVDDRLAAVGSVIFSADPPGHLQYDGVFRGAAEAAGAPAPTPAPGTRPAQYVSGAGTLVRLEALEREGYLEEQLFCYWEEIEWCARLAARGWRFAVCGGSRVIHRGGGSDLGANSHYYLTRNPFLVLRHVETGRRRAALRGAIYRGVSGTNLARQAGDREKWLAIAAGLRDGLRGRFGKRPADSPGPAFVALLGWWTLCASLRDKWRAARGLAPGYPPLERCLLGDLAGARSHRHD